METTGNRKKPDMKGDGKYMDNPIWKATGSRKIARYERRQEIERLPNMEGDRKLKDSPILKSTESTKITRYGRRQGIER